jgi:hypothetical protein
MATVTIQMRKNSQKLYSGSSNVKRGNEEKQDLLCIQGIGVKTTTGYQTTLKTEYYLTTSKD